MIQTSTDVEENDVIHGYHLILPMYGVWLPNDPRGSWSDTVCKWELLRFGKPTRTAVRRSLVQLTDEELALRDAAHSELRYPPVQLNGLQAKSIGDGFSETVHKNGYTVWACAILPQHVHLVLARHTYKVEQMATLLKGAATMRMIRDGHHPLADYLEEGNRYPKMWAEKRWKVYLDSEQQLMNAIRYVEDNPEEEGRPRQHWKFITPFRGLEPGHITYY